MTSGWIAAIALAVVMVFAMPYYCVLTYRAKSKSTLIYKMFLSTLFVAGALISLVSASVRKPYDYLLVAGFLLCWIGDYILGRSERMTVFLIGSAAFTAGHAFFITSFSLAASALIPHYHWFNGVELGFFAAIYALEFLLMFWRRPPFHKLYFAMFTYYAVVLLMAAKAFGLAIRLYGNAPGLLMFPIGALLFVLSDYLLGMMRFKILRRTVTTKSTCTISYFAAQMLMVFASFTLFRL